MSYPAFPVTATAYASVLDCINTQLLLLDAQVKATLTGDTVPAELQAAMKTLQMTRDRLRYLSTKPSPTAELVVLGGQWSWIDHN